eukprot:TRINITY_DN1673_c0_g1_i1.p1 TRINITY_DN1673_c0_g1~~TRINITY_DN1673_c0_g1_i1.p1  ORF type:complete len:195 (-),score=82.87 TRINITY_DN1673_c0_g1_i1:233-817(-)
MARGRSRGHKGGRKQFSNPDQIKEDLAKQEEKRLWREAHPDSESESESEEERPVRGAGRRGKGAAKEESSSSAEEESSSSEEEDENAKKKGVAGMIEIENPNRVKKTMKKVSQLDDVVSAKPQLSRREREEIEKVKAKAHYQKQHAAGKTDEARADLARLSIIRKQREDAAAKRTADQAEKDAAAKAKADSKKK